MRCDEVIRELAVPTDVCDSAALAEHLANCSTCAGWAKRDAQFDRLWSATRPIEPSPQVWDTMWTCINSSLDSAAPAAVEATVLSRAAVNGSVPRAETPLGLTPMPSRSRRWNWAAIGLIGLAQAAAVLLVVGLTWRSSSTSQQPQLATSIDSPALSPDSSRVATEAASQSVPVVEIEPGQQVVIQLKDAVATVIDVTPDRTSYSVDDWYLVFNAFEAIAHPVVAMKE
jgi:hypothetical protein